MLRKTLQTQSSAATCSARRGLANPPSQKQCRSHATEGRIWTAEQLRKFLHHVAYDRLHAAWMLFATTGMRRGEVAGFPWRQVDLAFSSVSQAKA